MVKKKSQTAKLEWCRGRKKGANHFQISYTKVECLCSLTPTTPTTTTTQESQNSAYIKPNSPHGASPNLIPHNILQNHLKKFQVLAMADGSSSNTKSNSLILHHPTNLKGGWNAAIFIICESKSKPLSLSLHHPFPLS